MNPLTGVLELLQLGQTQLVGLASALNGDASIIGGQLISAFNSGGSLLLFGLSQAVNQLPALPSLNSFGI